MDPSEELGTGGRVGSYGDRSRLWRGLGCAALRAVFRAIPVSTRVGDALKTNWQEWSCLGCGTTELRHGDQLNRKFCGGDCYHKCRAGKRCGEWIAIRCRNPKCDRTFEVQPHRSNRMFCSQSCSTTARNLITYANVEPRDWTNWLNKYRPVLDLGTACLICGEEEFSRSEKRHHVDHCHKTGKVRGLLCQRCNLKLGWYEKYQDQINSYLMRPGSGVEFSESSHT